MFTAEDRDHVRHHVLEMAKADPRVRAAAITGSMAFGPGDTWSDVGVAFGIADGNPLEPVLEDWTKGIDQEFGVLDHFDRRTGSWIYRVFLLESGLQVDVAVTPAHEFGARGPNFRALFGTTHQAEPISGPEPSSDAAGSTCFTPAHASSARGPGRPCPASVLFARPSSPSPASAWERTPPVTLPKLAKVESNLCQSH